MSSELVGVGLGLRAQCVNEWVGVVLGRRWWRCCLWLAGAGGARVPAASATAVHASPARCYSPCATASCYSHPCTSSCAQPAGQAARRGQVQVG